MTKKSLIQNEPTAPSPAFMLAIANLFISEPINYIDESGDFLEFMGDCLMDTPTFDSQDTRRDFVILKNMFQELHACAKRFNYDERANFAKWALLQKETAKFKHHE